MTTLSPIRNLPFLYVNELMVNWLSTTTLSVSAGRCRDSTNVFDLELSAATVNGAINGINGLDTGTLAASQWYSLFAIGDSSGFNPTGFILSLSASAPTLPAGYDLVRKICWVLTNSSSQFPAFFVYGNGSYRTHIWDAQISVLSGGAATSYTAVSLNAGVPPADKTPVNLSVSFTPNAAADYVTFRPTGSASTTGPVFSGVVATKAQVGQLKVMSLLSASVAKIDYLNSAATGATTLLVNSFEYSI